MKTQINELKSYITNLFQLTSQENWECEALNESADNILPERFLNDSPLSNRILETYTYYNNELHELSIYPFLYVLSKTNSSASDISITMTWTFYILMIHKRQS